MHRNLSRDAARVVAAAAGSWTPRGSVLPQIDSPHAAKPAPRPVRESRSLFKIISLVACLIPAAARAGVPAWIQEPASTRGLFGERVKIKASASLEAPLLWQWHHQGRLFPPADHNVLSLLSDIDGSGSWQALIRSAEGEAWSAPVEVGVVWPVPAPGVVDGGFVPRFPWSARFHSLTLHGTRLIAAGEIVDPVSGASLSGCLAGLQEDGSLIPAFTATPDKLVRAVVSTSRGLLVTAGDFTTWSEKPRSRLAFLSENGKLLEPPNGSVSPSADAAVHCLLPLPDGRLVIGGAFSSVNDTPRAGIARLLPDGTLDSSFQAPPLNGPVFAMLDGGNGTLIIGGGFTALGPGGSINRVARLHPDGSLDTSFAAAGGATGDVLTLARQEPSPPLGPAEPRIVVGGAFLRMHGMTRQRLARLKADGSLDTAFRADADAPVRAVLVEAPGGIVVAGDFVFLRGRSCSGLARLAPNSSGGVVFESTFRPAALDHGVRAMINYSTGGFAAAGDFTLPRPSVLRVWSTFPPAEMPQILALPESVSPVAGGPLHLTATVRGFPAPALRWYHGDLLVSESGPALRINQIASADAGAWRLEASNNSGTAVRHFSVAVRPAPWPGECPRRTWTRDAPLLIPDGGTVEAPLSVTGSQTIHRLRVSVNLQHVETGDLTLTLIAPDGATALLMVPGRRIGWDLAGTTFDDAAAMNLAETADPHPGSCLPAEPLGGFHGKGTAGVWRLRIEDRLPDNVSGTLSAWTLEADGPPVSQSLNSWAAAEGKTVSDSLTLLQDYALGLSAPVLTPAPGGSLDLLLEQPTNASDFSLTCESSSDLSVWTPYSLATPDVSLFIIRYPTGRELLRYRMTGPSPEDPSRFFRFRVRRL